MDETTTTTPIVDNTVDNPDNLIVTSSQAENQFNDYSQQLSSSLTGLNQTQQMNQYLESMDPSNMDTTTPTGEEITVQNVSSFDPYAQMLDEMALTSSTATKALIGSIQASRQNQENEVNTMFDRYTRGLQLLGIQTNQAQFTPDLLMGQIKSAENEKMKKIKELDREEKKMLLDAEMAQQDKNLGLLREKMDRVKEIKRQKLERLKDLADFQSLQMKMAQNHASSIYQSLKKVPAEQKESFLMQISQQFGIPLFAIMSSLTDIAQSEKVSTVSGGGGSSVSTGKKLTFNQLETLRGKYPEIADQLVFGIKEGEADELVRGIEGFDESDLLFGTQATTEATETQATAQTLEMTNKRAKKLEDAGINAGMIIYIQQMLSGGYSIDEILGINNFSQSAQNLLKKYVK